MTHTSSHAASCRAIGLWLGALAALCSACGARGDPFEPADAGVCSPEDASASDRESPRDDNRVIPWDALSDLDLGPATECIACLRDSCRQWLDSCLGDDACSQGLVCSTLLCEQGDPQCEDECYRGDDQAALNARLTVVCVTARCGTTCLGRLLDLEGLLSGDRAFTPPTANDDGSSGGSRIPPEEADD